MQFYLEGNWPEARQVFEKTKKMLPCLEPLGDGPSKQCLKVMAKHGYNAPNDWPGY